MYLSQPHTDPSSNITQETLLPVIHKPSGKESNTGMLNSQTKVQENKLWEADTGADTAVRPLMFHMVPPNIALTGTLTVPINHHMGNEKQSLSWENNRSEKINKVSSGAIRKRNNEVWRNFLKNWRRKQAEACKSQGWCVCCVLCDVRLWVQNPQKPHVLATPCQYPYKWTPIRNKWSLYTEQWDGSHICISRERSRSIFHLVQSSLEKEWPDIPASAKIPIHSKMRNVSNNVQDIFNIYIWWWIQPCSTCYIGFPVSYSFSHVWGTFFSTTLHVPVPLSCGHMLTHAVLLAWNSITMFVKKDKGGVSQVSCCSEQEVSVL